MSWQRGLSTGSRVMTTLILSITLIFVLFSVFIQSTQKGWTKQGVFRVMVVLSGSMSPVFNTGDGIILVSGQAKSPYKIGEIITFRDPENGHRLITHRVIGVVVKAGDRISYCTKGDANRYADQWQIPEENVVGKEIWRLPYFGKLIEFAQSPMGTVLLLIIPGLVVITGEFGSNLRPKQYGTQKA